MLRLFCVKIHQAFTAPVKDLWSNFELQLQDAIFEAMDLQQNHRRRSARDIEEIWTGFVPSLYQQRERNMPFLSS